MSILEGEALFQSQMRKCIKDIGIKPTGLETDEVPDEEPENSLQRFAEKYCRDRAFPIIHDRSRKKNKKGEILDLYVWKPGPRHIIFEFKARGKKMSPEQKETFRRLKFMGFEIYECKSKKRFLEIMEMEH